MENPLPLRFLEQEPLVCCIISEQKPREGSGPAAAMGRARTVIAPIGCSGVQSTPNRPRRPMESDYIPSCGAMLDL